MIDLEEMISTRIVGIRACNASVSTDFIIREVDGHGRGVIIVSDGKEAVQRFEFMESEGSWNRPGAVEEYNSIAALNIPVTVIVPSEAFLEVSTRVQEQGNRDIVVFSYDAIVHRRKPLPI